MLPYTANGPRAGRGTGRARNTLANNRSKTAPVTPQSFVTPPPPVSPASAVAAGGQMAGLQLTLGARLAALRAQRGVLQGQFREAKAGVNADQVAGMAGAESNALSRGILGSSADLGQRVAVDSAAAQGMTQAIQAKVQGILGLKMDRISAANDYYTGVFNIQAQKAAEQAQAANDAFLKDLVMRLGDETAPGGSASGAGAATPGAAGTFQSARNPNSGYQYPTARNPNTQGPITPTLTPQQQAVIDAVKKMMGGFGG